MGACLAATLAMPSAAIAADLAVATAPVIEWMVPPAWRQSGTRSVALRPGMNIAEGDTVITGAGGGASIRIDPGKHVLILERTAWTWTDASDGSSGDVQQGEVRIYRAQADRPRGDEPAGNAPAAALRMHADGSWSVALFSSASRSEADNLLGYLERNGFPAVLRSSDESSKPGFKVALSGFRGVQDAMNAVQTLKGRFPGVDNPVIDGQFRQSPVDAALNEVGRATEPDAVPRKAEAQTVNACIEWGSFRIAELARARKALTSISPAPRMTERHAEAAPGWWTYLPPGRNLREAVARTEQLRRMGIAGASIVKDDPEMRFAISLGMYDTREAANRRLAQLRSGGVKTAKVGQRKAAAQKVFLQLHGIAGPARAGLEALHRQFPSTEVTECPAAQR